MIRVVATIYLKPGAKKAYVEAFKANVPKVLEENGCISYEPAVDLDSGLDAQTTDENSVMVIEKWESLDALQVHLAAPHMDDLRTATEGMVDTVDLRILTPA